MHKALRVLLVSLILGLFTAGFIVWSETPAQPMPKVLTTLTLGKVESLI
jgi:type IV secretory pathway TrbF-like protein